MIKKNKIGCEFNQSYKNQLVEVWIFDVGFWTSFVSKIPQCGPTDHGLYSTLTVSIFNVEKWSPGQISTRVTIPRYTSLNSIYYVAYNCPLKIFMDWDSYVEKKDVVKVGCEP